MDDKQKNSHKKKILQRPKREILNGIPMQNDYPIFYNIGLLCAKICKLILFAGYSFLLADKHQWVYMLLVIVDVVSALYIISCRIAKKFAEHSNIYIISTLMI